MQAVKTATENSGKQLRETLTRWVVAAKAWLTAPWSGGRAAKLLAIWVALAAVLWAGWRLRFRLFELRFARRGHRGDEVRHEAGRWLARLRGAPAPIGHPERVTREAVIADLQRLRFGARESWGDAAGIFRRARQATRVARSVRGRANRPR